MGIHIDSIWKMLPESETNEKTNENVITIAFDIFDIFLLYNNNNNMYNNINVYNVEGIIVFS